MREEFAYCAIPLMGLRIRRWREPESRGEGLVSVQGQENILKWVGGTVTQCCDP